MVAPVKIEWDKKPVAQGGVVKITGYDPYAKNNEWTAKASDGNTYTGAEVTSEGFQIFGLPPYAYYSAGLACFMYGPNSGQWMQDNHDVWNNSMDLAGIQNGGIIGFKYFGFGGLAQDTKGVKAFAGTKKGDNTTINLSLTPSGKGAFKIHFKLDDPWKGQEIGVIDVPASAPQTAGMVNCVVPAVEGLAGKHAIYLVVEGDEIKQPEQPQGRPQFGGGRQQQGQQRPQGLFDLHGISFAKGVGAPAPVVPTITVTVDGKEIKLPTAPMFATNDNGFMMANNYQAYAPLKDNSVIKATASDPGVTFEIGKVSNGRAIVKATYKGQTKNYFIN